MIGVEQIDLYTDTSVILRHNNLRAHDGNHTPLQFHNATIVILRLRP